MDIFLLLPSCGWSVNQFYFIIAYLTALFSEFTLPSESRNFL